MKVFAAGIAMVMILVTGFVPSRAEANATREFIMSCTYGVLAGTLVGAASLAFTNKPSDNMNRVARGASLGLYTGILLGVYVVYIVPGMEEEEPDPVAELQKRMDNTPLLISPNFTREGRDGQMVVDGARADWMLHRF